MDYGIIYYRKEDNSYIIKNGTYHVPNYGEYVSLYEDVKQYALNNPDKVLDEPEQVAPKLTDEEISAQKLSQAKVERAEAVSKITVEVDGMVFDGDETSQDRMSRTISAAMALGVDLNTEKRIWVLADNTIAEVTIAQLAEALRLAGDAQTSLWTIPYMSN